eukprot:g8963.t1
MTDRASPLPSGVRAPFEDAPRPTRNPATPRDPAAFAAFLPPDPLASGRFLSLTGGGTGVYCHTNCRQEAQGTAFFPLPPTTTRAGRFEIQCRNKPGRMRYFVGLAEQVFPGDAGCADIARHSLVSLENLKADLHANGVACARSAVPCFHTGSRLKVEWRELHSGGNAAGSAANAQESCVEICVSVDTTKFRKAVTVKRTRGAPLYGFVSLYNREALFELVDCG